MARKQTTAPSIPLSRRALVGQPIAVDRERRSFSIIISTETPVRTFILNPACAKMSAAEIEACDYAYIEVDEVLLTAGLDYSRAHNMPFMDNHDTQRGLDATLGRVYGVRAEDGKVVGEPVLSRRHADLLDDIEDGLFPQISAGYVVNAYDIIERPDNVPLAIATSWTLHEASAVPVGADPNATVRGRSRKFPMPKFSVRTADGKPKLKEKNMDETDLEQLVEAATEALEAVAEATDEGATEEVVERAKRLREIADELLGDPEDQERKRRRGKREDEDEAEQERKRRRGKREDEELTEDEEAEIDEIEEDARAFGLRSYVRTLRKLKGKPSFVRSALRQKIADGKATFTDAAREARRNSEPRKQAEREPTIDVNAIYARANKRGFGRRG